MSINGEKKCPICKCSFLERPVTEEDDSTKCKSCQKLYPDGLEQKKPDEATKLFLGKEQIQEMINSAMHSLRDEMLCILESNKHVEAEKTEAPVDDSGDELGLDEVENEKD